MPVTNQHGGTGFPRHHAAIMLLDPDKERCRLLWLGGRQRQAEGEGGRKRGEEEPRLRVEVESRLEDEKEKHAS